MSAEMGTNHALGSLPPVINLLPRQGFNRNRALSPNAAVERTDFEQSPVNIGFYRNPRRTCLVQNAAAL